MNSFQQILKTVSAIREEQDTEKRLLMLRSFNDSLPENVKLQMPSLITNAYVRKALDMIEKRASLLAMKGNSLSSTAA
jgi:hypothetical protein